jgi:hypothetical protein
VDGLSLRHTQQEITPAVTKTGRRCGECSLCCRLLDVQELKPTGEWCPHCKPGAGGCTIYQKRPPVCRNYACAWLMNSELNDLWFPAYARIVVDGAYYPDQEPTSAINAMMRFHVCPHTPDRWREEPYYGVIKSCSLRGLRGYEGDHWFTIVTVGHHHPGFLVLPHREVECQPGLLIPLGPDRFEYVPERDREAALKMNDLFANLQGLMIQTREAKPEITMLECFDLVAKELAQAGPAHSRAQNKSDT